MKDSNTYDSVPVVLHKEYLNRSSGDTINWDGKDYKGLYVDNGKHRVKITAIHTDGVGITEVQTDVDIIMNIALPLEVKSFSVSNANPDINTSITINYLLSKPANGKISVFDSQNNEVLPSPGFFSNANSGSVSWTTPNTGGLYLCKIEGTAVDDNSYNSASGVFQRN